MRGVMMPHTGERQRVTRPARPLPMSLRFFDWLVDSLQATVACLDRALDSVHGFLAAVLDRLSRRLVG